jgi:hypothetical protein
VALPEIKVYIDPVRMHLMLQRNSLAILTRAGPRAITFAKSFVPVRTGQLRDDIKMKVTMTAAGPMLAVGSDLAYARWVMDGTGIYGKYHTPIMPVTAQFLVFQGKKDGRLIVTSSVRGQPGRPFLKQAMQRGLGSAIMRWRL